MLDLSVKLTLNEIDEYPHKLIIGNQKCSFRINDNADGVMIPMCRPCFAGDTINNVTEMSYSLVVYRIRTGQMRRYMITCIKTYGKP